MQAPSATLRPLNQPVSTSSRAITFVLAVILNLAIIYALVTGLASQAVKVLVQNIDVAVIKEPPPDENKPPPPPPPQVREPPPFVPPPDINIDMSDSAPTTTAITTQSQAPTQAPPPTPDTAPKALGSHTVPPNSYPPISIRLGEEGKVAVRLLVDAEGNVADVQIVNGSGKARLDAAAIPVVKRWRYKPAMQAGKPVPMWIQAVVVFKLT